MIDGLPQQLRISLRQCGEAALEHLEDLAVLMFHPEDLGAEHGREVLGFELGVRGARRRRRCGELARERFAP